MVEANVVVIGGGGGGGICNTVIVFCCQYFPSGVQVLYWHLVKMQTFDCWYKTSVRVFLSPFSITLNSMRHMHLMLSGPPGLTV